MDASIIFAFIEVESSFNSRAFRNDRNGGSYGLMQLDLMTVQDRGFGGNAPELYDPCVNVTYGVRVLGWLTTQLTIKGVYSLDNLGAAFNACLTHVLNGGTDPIYSAKIVSAAAKWKVALGETA